MERDRKQNQRNDTLPGTKTRNKKNLIGTKKKKNGNIFLDRMQCIEFGNRQDNGCPKGELAKNAYTSIIIQNSQGVIKCCYVTSTKRLSNLKKQKLDTNLKRMLRTVMKQLFNNTLLRLKAYIPNPKGCTQNPIRVRSELK